MAKRRRSQELDVRERKWLWRIIVPLGVAIALVGITYFVEMFQSVRSGVADIKMELAVDRVRDSAFRATVDDRFARLENTQSEIVKALREAHIAQLQIRDTRELLSTPPSFAYLTSERFYTADSMPFQVAAVIDQTDEQASSAIIVVESSVAAEYPASLGRFFRSSSDWFAASQGQISAFKSIADSGLTLPTDIKVVDAYSSYGVWAFGTGRAFSEWQTLKDSLVTGPGYLTRESIGSELPWDSIVSVVSAAYFDSAWVKANTPRIDSVLRQMGAEKPAPERWPTLKFPTLWWVVIAVVAIVAGVALDVLGTVSPRSGARQED